jgi:hypothetical protein
MYWPLGVASMYNVPLQGAPSSEKDTGGTPLNAVSTSRSASIFVTTSADELFVWQTQVNSHPIVG